MEHFFHLNTILLKPKPLRYVSIKDIDTLLAYNVNQQDIKDKEDKENVLFPEIMFIETNSFPISTEHTIIDSIFYEDFIIQRPQHPTPFQHVDNTVLSRKRSLKACSF